MSTVRSFVLLLKPRVMSLVVFTGLGGMLAAPGESDVLRMVVAMVCLSLGAGAAGALNMWYDRDIDAVMKRTQNRPLPQARVTPQNALILGVVLTVMAVGGMGFMVNWVAAFLLALASVIYVGVYTMWLKRKTSQNIVIGGASGALPPMIGWAAVTGTIDIPAVLLFLIIFLWTPPHFWALALVCRRDYERAGLPMMPSVVGDKKTTKQMFIYTLLLWPVAVAPIFFGIGGLPYAFIAIVLSTLFVLYSIYVHRVQSLNALRQMFTFSILYLFLLFSSLIGNEIVSPLFI